MIPRIAVDLLGGDNAPAVVVDGALRALTAVPDLEIVLVGPRKVADEVVAALAPADRRRVSVRPAARGVRMSDGVSRGADPETSIAVAVAALVAGAADAVVSAGSSGATVAAAILGVGRAPGVRRPALAAVLPAQAGPLVLLDVGAGMQVNPVELVRHGQLGAAYAQLLVGIAHPRIGLLSIGAEPGKGDRLRRTADAALRLHPLRDAVYVGLVEGHDVVIGGRADVVVTDGFTGNVLLKGVEAASAGSVGRAAVPRGAVLLGVAGTVVVCHGAATGVDIATAIDLAARLARDDVVGRMSVGSPRPAGAIDADPHPHDRPRIAPDGSDRDAPDRDNPDADASELAEVPT